MKSGNSQLRNKTKKEKGKEREKKQNKFRKAKLQSVVCSQFRNFAGKAGEEVEIDCRLLGGVFSEEFVPDRVVRIQPGGFREDIGVTKCGDVGHCFLKGSGDVKKVGTYGQVFVKERPIRPIADKGRRSDEVAVATVLLSRHCRSLIHNIVA